MVFSGTLGRPDGKTYGLRALLILGEAQRDVVSWYEGWTLALSIRADDISL